MSTTTLEATELETLADFIDRLGGISPSRVRFHPLPGTATEADLLKVIAKRSGRIYELVDGTLVEKVMGYRESFLAGTLLMLLRRHVDPQNLGLVSGADGMMRLHGGLLRIPDVAFASWDRIPGRKVPVEPIPDLVPDLAIEVLSEGNTPAEMARKCREYFAAGVRLVWLIDPATRTAVVHLSPEESSHYDAEGTLDGGDVLPGLSVPLGPLFAELDRNG